MAITFTNTLGTGFQYQNTGSQSADRQVTTPSAATSSSLLLGFYGINNGTLGVTADTVLTNLSGESIITSVQSSTILSAQALYYKFAATPPATIDFNDSLGANVRSNPWALVMTGHDTTTPIRASATNSGSSSSITFPDTSSLQIGDLVFRYVWVDNTDTNITFSSFSETLIDKYENDGSNKNFDLLGYKTMASAAAPGTASVTMSASHSWVSLTVAVAVAGAAAAASFRRSLNELGTRTGSRGVQLP